MRMPMIAGNWKMNTTVEEAVELVEKMLPALDGIPGVEKVVCPPYVSLSAVRKLLKASSVKLGAQNLFYEEKGAYTGEVSPLMLSGLCEYVIIGHSERRQYFGESGEIVNRKVKAALKFDLKPILCVGENLDQREAGRTEEIIEEQLGSSLSGIKTLDTLTVAYEPIWAIGTGKAATGEQANDVIGFIRRFVGEKAGKGIAEKMHILYGGSMKEDNAGEFIKQPEIDGGLIGGASLKADQFISIVEQAKKA